MIEYSNYKHQVKYLKWTIISSPIYDTKYNPHVPAVTKKKCTKFEKIDTTTNCTKFFWVLASIDFICDLQVSQVQCVHSVPVQLFIHMK